MLKVPVITLVLLIGNELLDVQRTILSFLPFCDEILVFDNSTDGSIDIATKYATAIVPYESDRALDFAAWQNQCLGLVNTPWAWIASPPYYLETEREPEELKLAVLKCPEHALWVANWRAPSGFLSPDYQPNLVRPGEGQYLRPIHPMFQPLPKAVLDRVTTIRPFRTGWGEKELEARAGLYAETDPVTDMAHRRNVKSWVEDREKHPNTEIERTAKRY